MTPQRADIPTDALPVKAIYASKLNNGVGLGIDADQSEEARVYALAHARHTIKIVQQPLFLPPLGGFPPREILLQPFQSYEGNVFDALAEAIHAHHVDVDIIVSKAHGLTAMTMACSGTPQDIADAIVKAMRRRWSVSLFAPQWEVAQHLKIARVAFLKGHDDGVGAHAKFWIVDDHLLAIGSHNIYP